MTGSRTPITCQWCRKTVFRHRVKLKRLGFSIVPEHTDVRNGKKCRGSKYPSMEFYSGKSLTLRGDCL